ncbi:MAG: LacI family transcriptional regulator [Bifidobacteriaceae bacterium]|jgi:LacI family transcriptional regulator|nr:LacI family transcriptional regulator [Bifidobacteriaceae bacterium]
MATYHDIRDLTGLSLSTISKYFNGRNILEGNRVAIERAVASLDFRPNEFARSLRTQRSRTVGVALPSLASGFHMQIVARVESVLRGHGVSLMVRSNGFEDAEQPADDAVGFLAAKMVDGLIVAPSPPDMESLSKLRDKPIVMIDRPAEGIDSDAVIVDNEGAGASAARLLLDHGHREIGLLGGDPEVWTMPRRDAGFLAALADRGLSVRPECHLASPLTIADGTASMRRLLAVRQRPTAVFCTNYQLSLGALVALNESGLRIPDDISLVGFDIDEVSEVTRPRITTIVQPTAKIAAEAGRLMMAHLAAPPDAQPPYTVVTLDCDLLLGGSVARPS